MIELFEINDGDVVKLRNGGNYIVFCKTRLMEISYGGNDILVLPFELNEENYDENLKHKTNSNFDIMAVFLKPTLSLNDSKKMWVRREETISLSKEEKEILKNVNPRYRYITRDKNGTLIIWAKEIEQKGLHKDEKSGEWIFGEMNQKFARSVFSMNFSMFKHLFNFVSWNDSRPRDFSGKLCDYENEKEVFNDVD